MKTSRVLIIAGSDSGGGAGIQADTKTVTALGGYAATAITALTAQNTQGVFGIHEVPTAFIAQQMVLVLDDIGADAIKTGMLHSVEVIETVVHTLKAYHSRPGGRVSHELPKVRSMEFSGENSGSIPIIVDPVMVAKGGAPLLKAEAVHALEKQLLPMARIVTPNLPEAELLSGIKIRSVDDMRAAAKHLLSSGANAVLIKGGHLDGDTIYDLLVEENAEHLFTSPRIVSRHTHGTGCTLASAIATGIAQGMPLKRAVERAREYVQLAIKTAPGLGKGHGPLNHAVRLTPEFSG